jgi:endoglucanase
MDHSSAPSGLSRRSALAAAVSAICTLGLPSGRTNAAERLPLGTMQVVAARPRVAPRPVTTFEGGTRDWEEFRRRFISADGRVIDTGNGGCSHSEGQGYGLMFAVGFNDPDSFDLVLRWTERHLRRPYDALHAWRYLPGAPCPVADWNNATDGDMFIAAALSRAARRWNRPDYLRAAAAIARDILAVLVRQVGGRTVLLPGATGFEAADSVTVNPSYYAFPILAELGEIAPSPVWDRVIADGIALIQDGRFGAWQLPPDWLRVARADGALQPDPRWPARFSYDAIRVPLHLAWGRVPGAAGAAFCAWAASRTVQPAWVDLRTNADAGYAASPGMTAIARLATASRDPRGRVEGAASWQPIRVAPDYYSASLMLLARLAWQESRPAAAAHRPA